MAPADLFTGSDATIAAVCGHFYTNNETIQIIVARVI